ncbi:MAG TPA: hypothetical protein VGP46_05980, partial [Acidimicrobiales bacterium]|nr:hypothetical protein [Acidimicrobiales bacterium]
MTDTSINKARSGADLGSGSAGDGSEWPAAVPELDALLFQTIGTPEGRQDPYACYKTLRDVAPVYRSGLGFTVCTRYEECTQVLRDPRLGKNNDVEQEQAEARFGHLEVFPRLIESMEERRSLLFLNPPDHTRLRRLVSKAFTPRTVEKLRPHIVELVEELLDNIAPGEVVDVMEALAFRLPSAVISKML